MITILTTGSRGDTQPYIALGQALKKAGQHVRIAAFENYASFVQEAGLEFYPIRGDVSLIAASADANNFKHADNPLKVIKSFSSMKKYVFDLQDDFFNACNGAEAIIFHPGAPIGYFAAQYFNVPSIFATPFPMTPTGDYPALIFNGSPLTGKAVNRLTHQVFERIMWMASSAPIKTYWKAKFGANPRDFRCPFPLQNKLTSPTLISCSTHVFPRSKDWPVHIHQTGYFFMKDEPGWAPPTDLQDFLTQGPPPVYVGFGSVGDSAKASQTTELTVRALRESGQRGILATGWQGMSRVENLPDDVFVLESAPHSWLFPQMSAVVHHGGAGTTAAGFRAGVPSIIIPHGNDQFAWSRRAHQLGVSPAPIPRKELTSEKLAEAIRCATGDSIRSEAVELGKKIMAEQGAEDAAKVVIDCIQSSK